MRLHPFPCVVAADWSVRADRRAAFIFRPDRNPPIERLDPGPDLAGLLERAGRSAGRRPLWVGLDVGLGIPGACFRALRASRRGAGPRHFADWIRELPDPADRTCTGADDWCPERPFFRVPAGSGSLRAFAGKSPGLWREVDRATGAKPVFALSGIPGVVGQASRSAWSEIHRMHRAGRTVPIWPFDVALGEAAGDGPILAELYPRLFYPAGGLGGAKGRSEVRARALAALSPDASLADLRAAEASEDAFDALVALTGVVRWLERTGGQAARVDPVAEGGMLGWDES